MTTDKTTTEHGDKGRLGMIDTMIHLGTATTNLAIDQVGNAFTALVHPGKAIDHVKDTLRNLSDAMNDSAGASHSSGRAEPERHASDLRGAPNGMEYVSTEPVRTAAEERRPAGTHSAKARGHGKINHRKG